MPREKTRRRKWLPYLEPKGELDAEEQRKNELEAIRAAREIYGEAVYELPAEVPRPELKNAECVGHLPVPLRRSGSEALYTLVSIAA